MLNFWTRSLVFRLISVPDIGIYDIGSARIVSGGGGEMSTVIIFSKIVAYL